MKILFQHLPATIVTAFMAASSFIASTQSFAVDVKGDLESPEAVEQRVKEKIESRLNLFLEPNEYRLFATAKISNYREKILLEGEMESLSKGLERDGNATAGLPGFKEIETPTADKTKDVNRKERSKFTFRNRSKLSNLTVKLILEETLAQNIKELATSTVQETLLLTVGDVATFEKVELNLVPVEANVSAWQWFTNYMGERGGSAIDLLYLSLLLIGFLASIFMLRFYFREKKRRLLNAEKSASNRANEVVDQQQIEDFCSQKLDELIDTLTQSPLIARNFLCNLELKDKQVIFGAVKTPAMQSYFRKVLALSQPAVESQPSTETKQTFARLLKDLRRYILLNVEMEAKPFGYMSQLNGAHIAHFLDREPDRLGALKTIAPYMADFHVAEVAKGFSIAEKSAFLQGIRNAGGEVVRESVLHTDDAAKRIDIDRRLRTVYESARMEAAVDVADPEVFESSFLEGDRQSVEVIKKMAAEYGAVPSKYEKYLINFEDFLGLDLGIGKRVLKRISNETLTRALAKHKFDKRIVGLLGEMRSQLIESLQQREETISSHEIEEAQNEVLRQYRSLV